MEFGVVSKYFPDKGFGFVRGLLLETSSETFFHIKTIKKTDSQLAARLINYYFDEKGIHFWFETEVTPKGTQVRAVLLQEQIRVIATTDQNQLCERVEFYWRNLERQKPSWLDVVTSDLVGRDRTNELSLERERLEAEEKVKLELARKELETNLAIEQERKQQQLNVIRAQEQIEESEFQILVDEVESLGFTQSSQLSKHIIDKSLGYKYKNISGIVQMERDGKTWPLNGGSHQKCTLNYAIGWDCQTKKQRREQCPLSHSVI